ncbi:YihY/virulence factor BrkB family protein [Arthrobacter sp. JZ12]|uniref:YihY/virulence factor BrkB family protein n=1 Tax=Arthrobacter sp. JZ12 TaxID=2654190 RepID=UPI002B463C85|nr:YihY/virulence factor BrkB family protein [Arthrobacter sp. JZ12]WRH24334.1 YihY/virulence factor BrkB family protein [Arthrobacter sp. JZ12]
MAKTLPTVKKQKQVPETPLPTDREKLQLRVLQTRGELGRVRREKGGGVPALQATIPYLLARLNAFRPMRAFQLYTNRHGPLMAAGIAYNMFFAIAALLVVGFSIVGLVVSGDTALQGLIVRAVDSTTPGLIDTDGEGGVSGFATPEELFSLEASLSIALAVSTVTMLLTALGWIAGLREGMRGIFDLPALQTNLVLQKLKDLGILLVLAVVLVVTTGVGLVANTVIDLVLQWVGLTSAARPLTQLAGFVVTLLLDTLVAVILFRTASAIEMPRTVLLQSALIAGIGSTLLRTFSTLLLAGVDRNPLLAPFAVILGLFVWFFLLSQVYLIATAWGAIGAADARSARPLERGGWARSLLRRSKTTPAARTP